MPYADLPEPKFAKGQTLWYADATKVSARHPCPDCLGTKLWRVETPGGGDYEVPCQRCSGGYTYTRHDNVVSLDYLVWRAAPRSFVVKEIEVRTKGHFSSGPTVTYDGRGEGGLFGTEAAALAASEALAAERNAKEAVEPERLAKANIGKLQIADAKVDQFANGLWNAWYAYNSLVEKLDHYLEGKDTLSEADVGYLKSDIRWETEYRAKAERPLDRLVEAVRQALDGDRSGLVAAYEGLPSALRTVPAKADSHA